MILEIYNSFRAMPLWVQAWVALILAPVNMASLYFYSEPAGLWIAFLANIAMMMNLPVMLYDRGFSKMMAIPHLVPWTILVLWIFFYRPEAAGNYDIYLTILLTVDTISLLFDFPDAIKWLNGERTPAGK